MLGLIVDTMLFGQCADAREPLHPGEPIRVIVAGAGRMGTNSISDALDMLGFRTMHSRHLAIHEDLLDAFASDDDHALYRLLARKGYNATIDLVMASQIEEQLARYPNAKVIRVAARHGHNLPTWFDHVITETMQSTPTMEVD